MRWALLAVIGAGCGVERPWTETDHALASALVGDSYDVRIVVPDAAPTGEAWPVLVFQDGDYWPDQEVALARALTAGEVPPFVLVAVGYQGFEHGAAGGLSATTLDRRARDITEDPVVGYPSSGGADTYQRFLAEELLPFVRAEVDVRQDRDGLATWGFSAYGGAALYGLLAHNGTFGGVCAGSPSLQIDGVPQLGDDDIPEGEDVDGWVTVTLGDEETLDRPAVDDAVVLLEAQAGLEVAYAVFEGRNHRQAARPGFERCLESLASHW